jgi:hypothetical protein
VKAWDADFEQKSRASEEILDIVEYAVDGKLVQIVVDELRDAYIRRWDLLLTEFLADYRHLPLRQ